MELYFDNMNKKGDKKNELKKEIQLYGLIKIDSYKIKKEIKNIVD